jgi:hypothetical protein
MPHYGVTTRLAPSPIHGVGVFAICDISKGQTVFGNDGDIIWMSKSQIPSDPIIKKLYDDFCILGYWSDGVLYNDHCGCPVRFDKMTTAWYLNHSDSPNLVCDIDDGYSFRAIRDIAVGEELTVDYGTYSQEPNEP